MRRIFAFASAVCLIACTVIGAAAEESTEIPAHVHEMTRIDEVPADCEHDGVLCHYVCNTCGGIFLDEAGECEADEEALRIPASHTLIEEEEREPGCESRGVKVKHYVCTVCGKRFRDEQGTDGIEDESEVLSDPTGHVWGEWEILKEPGAEEPGMKVRYCLNTPAVKILRVTIDAGHGPNDNRGVIDGYYEGRAMFALMTHLVEELKKYDNIEIFTTRQTVKDEPALESRGTMAAENGSELFISLHSNWFSNQSAAGVSVYRSYFRPESEELGSLLGMAVTEVINEVTGITYMRNDDLPMTRIEPAYGPEFGDGVDQDYYNVIRNSVMSDECRYSFIIEHGFHSNPAECGFLMSDENLKKIAKAEADVIGAYFGLYPAGTMPERHAEYEEIPPLGPLEYDIDDGFTVNASKAFKGGVTVSLRRLSDDETAPLAEKLPGRMIYAAFSFSASDGEEEIPAAGSATVTYVLPEGTEPATICVALINDNGISKKYADVSGAEATFQINRTGLFVICAPEEGEVLNGDVNGDGKVNNKDVVLLFRTVSGVSENAWVNEYAADYNRDGKTNNKDVIGLFKAASA